MTVDDHPGRRLRACVEAWPDCYTMDYDPRCCRFPKSCSASVYSTEHVREEDLEPVSHFRSQCIHGVLVSQCRCMAPNKEIRIVPCPPRCHAAAEAAELAAHKVGRCGATRPSLLPGRVCELPAGHSGAHEVNDSMGRVEFYWPQPEPEPILLRMKLIVEADLPRSSESNPADTITGALREAVVATGLHLDPARQIEVSTHVADFVRDVVTVRATAHLLPGAPPEEPAAEPAGSQGASPA